MSDHYTPPFGAMMQSLLTGQLDHGSLLRMPNLHGRPFWLGAAIGAGLVLALRARSPGGGLAANNPDRTPRPAGPAA